MPDTGTVILEEHATRVVHDTPWHVVLHDDPVNYMTYVTLIIQKVMGYPRARAERHMMEVHTRGRSIVWTGLREKAELYVHQFHEVIRRALGSLRLITETSGDAPWLQDPVSGPSDEEAEAIREDWREVIQPELEENFRSQVRGVLDEIENAAPMSSEELEELEEYGFDEVTGEAPLYALEIPPESVEDWYGALNQGRLALEAKYHFGDRAKAMEEAGNWPQDRRVGFMHFTIYAAIQEALLHAMEQSFGGQT